VYGWWGLWGVKPNKSVRHFFTHNGRGCVFVFAVCSFGWMAGHQRFARVWLSRLEKWRAPSNHLENA